MGDYKVELIAPEEKDALLRSLPEKIYYRKANLHGMCIELLTDKEEFKEMWEDNFFFMSDDIRPHGRVVAIDTIGKMSQYGSSFRVLYEPVSKTAFFLNHNYYGWAKSIALAVAADFLEDYVSIHSRFSVHGSCIDFGGRGIAMIAPSGTGKTTHSFGLLFMPQAKMVSDDWFFVKLAGNDVVAYASEKNSYIREDISDIWKEFEPLVKSTRLGTEGRGKGRGIANVEDAIGTYKKRSNTVIRKIIILKRDSTDPSIVASVSVDEAMKYLSSVSFCNPHQLVMDERKTRLRSTFFRSMLEKAEVYIVNTVKPAKETHEKIRKIVEGI